MFILVATVMGMVDESLSGRPSVAGLVLVVPTVYLLGRGPDFHGAFLLESGWICCTPGSPDKWTQHSNGEGHDRRACGCVGLSDKVEPSCPLSRSLAHRPLGQR